MQPGGFDPFPISSGKKDFQPHINPRLPFGGWQWLNSNLSPGNDDIPTIRLIGDGDSLGGAFNGAAPTHTDAPNLGEDEKALVECGAIAVLLSRTA